MGLTPDEVLAAADRAGVETDAWQRDLLVALVNSPRPVRRRRRQSILFTEARRGASWGGFAAPRG